MKPASVVLLAIAFGLFFGCTDMVKGKGEAEKKISEFHDFFNEENFDEIYDHSSVELQKSTSKEKLVQFLEAVFRKLGKVTETDNKGWKVNNYNLRTYVVSVQETTFQNGKGTETFTYVMEEGKAVLLGYNINSPDLIIR